MSPEPKPLRSSAESARQDIEDIRSLRMSEPFNRYWMRRLKEKTAKVEEEFKYSSLDHESRECARQVMLKFEDLIKLMDTDEAICQRAAVQS